MPSKPDLDPVYDVVNPTISDAMEKASERLDDLGVRHALIGGLAVGAHGFPRATKDVDFLVGPEAFDRHTAGIISPIAGLPISVGGVAVDFIPIEDNEPFLNSTIEHPDESCGIPVADINALVYTKLRSPRPKDRLDLLELIAIGMDVKSVAEYVAEYAPKLLTKFNDIVADAAETE